VVDNGDELITENSSGQKTQKIAVSF